MNFEDLVPPLELCKQIPQGEFEDSCFVRIGDTKIIALRRSAKWSFTEQPHYPAPTLPEIMVEIDNLGGWCPTAYRLQNQWTVDYQEDKEDGMNDVVEQTDLDNSAAAALKLWLKLKGIEA